MILIKPSFEILGIYSTHATSDPLHLIELAGRTCYKSENKMTDDSAKNFVRMLTERGHHSVLEHSAMTVKFIVDRGVTHELVRHRLVAYSQESTRYCNYEGGVTFVIPPWLELNEGEYIWGKIPHPTDLGLKPYACWSWVKFLCEAEGQYIELIKFNRWTPQQARSVLPNALKTEIVATANLREWRHIFTLRCSRAAHPQMQEIIIPLLREVQKRIPVIFDSLVCRKVHMDQNRINAKLGKHSGY